MAENILLIKAECFPLIKREDIVGKCKYKLPLDDISGLGGGFAITAAAITQAVSASQNNGGLYRCVFPEGVTGHLAAFKDGSGLLGTIMNENGIVGQARWIPAESASVAMQINPVTIALAVAMIGINRKLDSIKTTQEEILQFLHQDKESKLEGALNSLSDILGQYQFNNDNEVWKGSQLTVVSSIKGTAEHNIIFYRKEIANVFGKQKLVHVKQQTDKMKEILGQKFKYYQLGVYIYAYASFLEVVLGGNFTKEYLKHTSDKVEDYLLQYRLDYSKCYEELEDYSRSSLQTRMLNGLGVAGTFTGNALEKIPVISKGPVDEALIAAGEGMQKLSSKHTDKVMKDFQNNRDAGIRLFVENIEVLNEISNKPVEVLFDEDELYICA